MHDTASSSSPSPTAPAAPPQPPLTEAERRAQTRRAFVEAGGTDQEWAAANGWSIGDELTGSTPTSTTTIRIHHFDAAGDCFARVLQAAPAKGPVSCAASRARVWSAPMHQPLRHRDWVRAEAHAPSAVRPAPARGTGA